jgi:hypothetical protein
MGTWGSFPGGKDPPGREADHSPPPSAEVKNAWSHTSTPQYAFMACCLVKHRGNFTFTPSLFITFLSDGIESYYYYYYYYYHHHHHHHHRHVIHVLRKHEIRKLSKG